jgi:hypothetical protein
MLNALSFILNFSPLVVVPAVFLWGMFAFWKKKNFWPLIWIMIGFNLFLALAKSILQYWVWNQGGMAQALLNLPLKKLHLNWFGDLPIFTDYSHGYFLYYIWNNFWRAALLSIVAALAAYIIFRLLRKYKKSLFGEGECEFGLLLSLLIGWPAIIIFLPLTLILAVFFSIGNWFYQRKAMIALFWPLAVSAAIMLIFSAQLAALRFLLFKL